MARSGLHNRFADLGSCRQGGGGCSILFMAKCRSMFVLVLVFAWTAMPALACLPNATMTQAEMACCKKMVGDCHMGIGQHPCCKTKVDREIPIATLDRTATQIHPYVVATLFDLTLFSSPTLDRADTSELRGLPPPSPPGLNSILRI